MSSCPICEASIAGDSNLCTGCADALPRPPGFCAEQLLSSSLHPTSAALVDCWGRVHALESLTPIGRRPVARGLAILEASVSRNHAELALDAQERWTLRDVGSSNGTLVDGEAIQGSVELRDKAVLSFGSIGLYFLENSAGLQYDGVASTVTVRPEDELAFGQDALDVALEPDEGTFAGFPKLEIRFFRASEGGGGMVEIGGTKLSLTRAQFDLVQHLVERMRADRDQAIELRGFSTSPRLMEVISWDTPNPSENHLKQLIRRVRKLLDNEGFGTLIESRRGFGYRVRCIPR